MNEVVLCKITRLDYCMIERIELQIVKWKCFKKVLLSRADFIFSCLFLTNFQHTCLCLYIVTLYINKYTTFFIITWDGHLELNLTYHKILIAKLQKLMTVSLCL